MDEKNCENKQRDDAHSILISGNISAHPEHPDSVSPYQYNHQDPDTSQKSPIREPAFVNRRANKVKAKYSDDEEPIGSEYDQLKDNETDWSSEFIIVPKRESSGLVNRKKKRSLADYYSQHYEEKKYSGLAEITPASDEPEINKATAVHNTEEATTSFKPSLIETDPKTVTTLMEGKENNFEQFDPTWIDEIKNEVTDNNVIPHENLPIASELSELNIATMEAFEDNELSPEEEILLEEPKAEDEHEVATASVSYQGLEGAVMTPVVHDNFAAINEAVFPIPAPINAVNSGLLQDLAGPSCSDAMPIFVQPRKNPWNVWPGLFDESLGAPTKDPFMNTEHTAKKTLADKWMEENQSDVARLLFQDVDKKDTNTEKSIAKFFAEKARALNEQDIANYSNNIEISKIEIYREDIIEYHQSLRYHRGPVNHDVIITTVETALNFVDKLVKEREQKKKVGFLPELFEKCLKSQATREKEKAEAEKKKKEQEEKKRMGPPKPKMWLVFNRLSKEKVIICAPGEFYDSD